MELEFEDTKATVLKIFQWRTYEGLLEGLPTDKLNKTIIEDVQVKSDSLTNVLKQVLIQPVEIPIKHHSDYPFGIPMELPGVVSIVKLQSIDMNGKSLLSLIFFQNSFSVPFEQSIIDKIKTLNWSVNAEHISWDDY